MKCQTIKTFDLEDIGSIRVVWDERSRPWFVAKDVGKVLGLKRMRDALLRSVPLAYRETVALPQRGRGTPKHTVLNIKGVFSLIAHTRNHLAVRLFAGWVVLKVLPMITDMPGWVKGLQRGLKAADQELKEAEWRDRYWYFETMRMYDEEKKWSVELNEAKERAEEAEKRLAEVLGTLQSLVGQRESK